MRAEQRRPQRFILTFASAWLAVSALWRMCRGEKDVADRKSTGIGLAPLRPTSPPPLPHPPRCLLA